MTPVEREIFYRQLIRIVRHLERSNKRVYPRTVAPHLDIYRCEQTLRDDMAYLARRGELIRVGGFKSRRGYCVPRPGSLALPAPFQQAPHRFH